MAYNLEHNFVCLFSEVMPMLMSAELSCEQFNTLGKKVITTIAKAFQHGC